MPSDVITEAELEAYLERLRADGWYVACKITEGGIPSYDEMIRVNREVRKMLDKTDDVKYLYPPATSAGEPMDAGHLVRVVDGVAWLAVSTAPDIIDGIMTHRAVKGQALHAQSIMTSTTVTSANVLKGQPPPTRDTTIPLGVVVDPDGWIDARHQKMSSPSFKVVDLDTGHIPKVVRCNLATGEWVAYALNAQGYIHVDPDRPKQVAMCQGRGRLALVPLDGPELPGVTGEDRTRQRCFRLKDVAANTNPTKLREMLKLPTDAVITGVSPHYWFDVNDLAVRVWSMSYDRVPGTEMIPITVWDEADVPALVGPPNAKEWI